MSKLPNELTDAELADQYRQALRAAMFAPRLTLRRFRLRRVLSRAGRALAERLLAHAGSTAQCESCQAHPTTVHGVTGDGATLRFHHYCATCASAKPVGWFAVSEATRKSP